MGGTSVSGTRRTTLVGRLVRLGFADPARAAQLLTSDLRLDLDSGERPGTPGAIGAQGRDEPVLAAIAGAADPDLALAGLARIAGVERGDDAADLRATLRSEPGFRQRLIAVLGSSVGLADHLARHPGDALLLRGADGVRRPTPDELRASLVCAVEGDPLDEYPVSDLASLNGADPSAALTAAYKRHILHLAARDLTGVVTVDQVAAELADIAAAALCAALSVARAQLPPGSPPARLAVIAMGKCGGGELNYASDVDVIFVAGPPATEDGESTPEAIDAALRTATRLAASMIRVCSRVTAEGMVFPVDPNLRPEGRNGPLVRTLASHLAYYERWAKTWEFQALLKARPAAGDMQLGQEYVDAVDADDLAGRAAGELRRRRPGHAPPGGEDAAAGPGATGDQARPRRPARHRVRGPAAAARARPHRRDAAQPVHAACSGRTGPRRLRGAGKTPRPGRRLPVPAPGRAPAAALPAEPDPHPARRPGRAAAAGPGPAHRRGRQRPAAGARTGRRRPGRPSSPISGASTPARSGGCTRSCSTGRCSSAVARLPGEVARLTPAAAQARLEALGYLDPAGALRHIEALTAGVSRRAAIQRTLLPVLLGWFADAAEPDAGLLAFRQVSDALGDSPWYLRLLRDETKAAERMARLLASSRYAAGLLLRAPEAVAILATTPSWSRGRWRRCGPRPRRPCAATATPKARWARSARCCGGNCSGSPWPTCSA